MQGKFVNGVIGLTGVASIEGVQAVQQVNSAQISEGVGLLSQIVILIVTLVGLFKKKKVTNNTNS